MEIKVSLNNIRIAPRKSRQVLDVIRGKSVKDAKNLLAFMVRRGAEPVLKMLNSAVHNAENNLKLHEDDLTVLRAYVDEGPTMKRIFPMSRGRAYPIMKRTSHITLVLSAKEKEKSEVKAKKKVKNTK